MNIMSISPSVFGADMIELDNYVEVSSICEVSIAAQIQLRLLRLAAICEGGEGGHVVFILTGISSPNDTTTLISHRGDTTYRR
jgi:hypothetical protein